MLTASFSPRRFFYGGIAVEPQAIETPVRTPRVHYSYFAALGGISDYFYRAVSKTVRFVVNKRDS